MRASSRWIAVAAVGIAAGCAGEQQQEASIAEQCAALGFEPATTAFRECKLELYKGQRSRERAQDRRARERMGEAVREGFDDLGESMQQNQPTTCYTNPYSITCY